MLPYGSQSIDDTDVAAVVEALKSDWLTTGPMVKRFEDAISELSGGRPVVSVSSGTAALHAAYSAMGLSTQDEVITTPMTFIATASMASILGAKVVFADVDPETGLIDPAAVASEVNERTKVIAAVDYAGHPADYRALGRLADTVGAVTLADAAHSIGGTFEGIPVGSLADVTTFSFFPTKNVTTGEGGAVVAQSLDLAQKVREFHNIGLIRDPDRFEIDSEGPWHQEVHDFGLNYRLTDIASALGLAQLARLNEFKSRRSEIFDAYTLAFSDLDGLRLPSAAPGADPMWHLYPLRVLDGRRRSVYDQLRNQGIGVQVNYMPVYWHPVYENAGYVRGMCPNAEQFYSEQLSIPFHPKMSADDVDLVIDKVSDALK